MIRALANKLQERAHGGPSLALKRHLNTLAEGSRKAVYPSILASC